MDDKISQTYRLLIFGNDFEREEIVRQILLIEGVNFINKDNNYDLQTKQTR